jgi:hypothetical protein
MRTAFKVATVFTGAAACAATFMPAAEAVTTTTAKTQHQVTPFTSKPRNCVIGPKTTSVVLTRPRPRTTGLPVWEARLARRYRA